MKWRDVYRSFLPWSVFLIGVGLSFPTVGRTAQPANGCEPCHPQLAAKLPKGHPAIPKGTVKDCLSCHSGGAGGLASLEQSAHLVHFAGGKFAGTCWSCHQIGTNGDFHLAGVEGKGVKVGKEMVEKMPPFFKSWANSNFMDHTHALKKVSCGACHGTFFPEERASDEQCFKCHKSYPNLAELTKNVKPNPHDSHLGEIRCSLCHKAHEKSVFYCNQCHAFDDKFSRAGK
jgi:hypothetical protein